ncbi:TIGR03086 family metal-binding protein [Mycobacterium sp. MUNTM1]
MAFADPTHFARAAQTVDDLLAHLTSTQWEAPTPCTDWNVTQVTQHVVEVNLSFAQQLHPTGSQTLSGSEEPGDLLDRYRFSTAVMQRALARTVAPSTDLPTQLRSRLALRVADLLLHGWDIAAATGQSRHGAGDLALEALTFAQRHAAALQRSGQFAPPQPIDDHAPAIDRLAALSGRVVPGFPADST